MESPDVHIELSVYLKCKTLEHVRVSVKVRERGRERKLGGGGGGGGVISQK